MGMYYKKTVSLKLDDLSGKEETAMDTSEPAELGSWRWLIVLASFLTNFLVNCALRALPVFFVEFVDLFQAGEAATAWIMAIQEFTIKGSGAVIAPLIKRYGCQRVACVGTLFASLGYIVGMYCQNVPQLLLSLGVLAGFGMGMMMLSALICVQYYFDKRNRSMASSFAIIGNSVGTLAGPPFNRWMMNLYSWRGALLVQAGVMLNGIVASSLLKPKPSTISLKEPQNEYEQSLLSDTDEHPHEENGRTYDVEPRAKNRTNPVTRCSGFPLLRNPAFVVNMSSNVCVFFGYIVPLSYLPERAAKHLGIGKLDAAFLISIIALTNIISRIGVGFIKNATVRFWVFLFTSMVCGIVSCLTPWFINYQSLAIYSSIFGVCHGAFLPLMVVIVVDIAGTDHVETAVAWSLASVSIPVLIGAPLAGAIIERTHSFDIPFLVAGIVQAFGAMLLLLIPLLFRDKKKYTKQQRRQQNSSRWIK